MSYLEVEMAGPIARIALNRPEIHNAFNEHVITELTKVVADLGSASSLEAIVLTGNGKSFCAGADLEWMGKMVGYSHDENLADARALQTLFETIAQCPKVVIAAVNGAAMGGGAGLVAACDYAIASDKASFAFSEVKLGIIPAVISPFVVEKIGLGAARAYFTTGRRFDAVTALRLGLVQEVVPAEDLAASVNSVLTDACSAGPKAIVASKALLRELARGTADTVEAIAQIRVSPEGQEGIRAFLEKRKPVWKRES
ncbi:enoyl-CoA hydratase-related protein [Armatimonas sp.]|uniref:enoyl-CoA hydratase-related protein n=1 Tax=Armatimonas sp. TaxID=1872638 RepID=UPI00374D6778